MSINKFTIKRIKLGHIYKTRHDFEQRRATSSLLCAKMIESNVEEMS